MNLPAAKLEQKVKHTPGPWESNRHELTATDIESAKVDGKRSLIACAYFGDRYRVSYEEMQANARLIVAAPEMLEALEAILANASAAIRYDLVANAREIIRKAKGEL